MLVVGGWSATLTWGIRPYVERENWGNWTDLIFNTSADGVVAGLMYFYAVPAMNQAFLDDDVDNQFNATLNPDLNV